MGYIETGKATQNPDFQLRVQVATFTAAQRIINEPEGTANHELRRRLASAVLLDPVGRVRQFLWIAAADPAISGTVKPDADPAKVTVGASDAQIQSAVDAAWDRVAGWSPTL